MKITSWMAAAVVLIAISTLLGWSFDFERLKRIYPSSAAMNPMTAVAFLCAGTSLVSACRMSSRRHRRLSVCLAILTGLIGALRLSAYAFGMDIGIDHLLFAFKLGSSGQDLPNRMAPNTAMNFILSAIGLLGILSTHPLGRRLASWASGSAFVIAYVAFAGHLYGVPRLYGLVPYIGMAVHTAAGFLFLSVGILATFPDQGLVAVLRSPLMGGAIARRLFPAAFVAPLTLGWIALNSYRWGLFDPAMAMAFFAVVGTLGGVAVVWMNSRLLDRVSEEIARATARLEATNQELEAFTYSISHDLRAPLRHVSSFVEMLRAHLGGSMDETSRHYVTTISEATGRLGRLIDELLTFSRTGRTALLLQPVRLDGLVGEVVREFSPETEGRDVEWKIGPLPEVRADAAMLRLVFSNLVGNALKFTRPRAHAVIEVGDYGEREGHRVVFVRDNGVGFDMRFADKLFGVFQRLHSENEFEGTGIGLANVRRIVSRHGGRAWAESIPENGATFYIALPPTKKESKE